MKIKLVVPHITDCVDTSYTTEVDYEKALNVGAQALNAVNVGRYYYYLADEVGEVFRLTPHEVAMYGAGKLNDQGVNYSLWCSLTGHRMKRPSKEVREELGME